MDTVSVETRSAVMAKVKSRGTRSTEWRLRASLIRAGVRGWTVNPQALPGSPDFVFPAEALVVFTDGCFWHGCCKCKRIPSSNVDYWDRKIQRNRRRDRAVTAQLRRDGWTVLRLWEHQLKSPRTAISRIMDCLETKRRIAG